AAAPETDQVKIIGELKAKGTDITTVLNAVDKSVDERSPEENKIVGDYSKLVPKGDLKPPEPPIEEKVPKEEKPAVTVTPKKEEAKVTEETPEEKAVRTKDKLADLRDAYNDIPASHNRKRAAVMRQIQGMLPEDYRLEVEGKGIKILNERGKKLIRSATTKKTIKLEDIEDPEEKKFISSLINERSYLHGLDLPMGPVGIDKAVNDLLAGRNNQDTQYVIDGLTDMYRRDMMRFKGEGQPDIEVTAKEYIKGLNDEKLKAFMEKNGGFTIENADKAVEEGLIEKEDVEEFKKLIQDENDRELKARNEWSAEEAGIDIGGNVLPEGKEAPPEVKGAEEPKPEINEKPINKPDITSGKGEGDIVPGSTEGNEKPVTPKGEEKPVRTTDVVKQKQIDAINKEYDKEIYDRQKELDALPKKIIKAINEANKRIGIFGDLKPIEPDEIIKREEQGFKVTSETVDAIRKPFLEREAELRKEIDALNKERESKIGEVLKQQTLGFEEPVKELPKKIVTTKEGVKYGDKTYTDIVDVLDDIENGTVRKEDGKLLREAVNTWEEKNKPESFADSRTAKQNKKYKNEPKTDAPEELAWDEPLPLSPAEDPNFKMSDLNNAMSIRNIARSFIKNMGKIEGADVRVGFIKRFHRKARGLFNPVSGIIRVNNKRDLRALTHEFGHLLDYEMFDIRGIISAKAADKQLGTGVDFNGDIYSNVKQVEEAMRSHNITIDEGNFLLEKVKSFEKKKLGEKYSEIVEQGSIVPVKYKGKTYRSDKEINNALAKGKMPTAKASQLIVNLNNLNKGRTAKLDKLRAKYGDDVVAGVLQRVELKKEFDTLLRDIGYPSKKRTEGIAEFVYNYVIDPKQLINSTPTALAWFEKLLDNAPAIKDALHTLREDFAKYDAQDVLTKGVAEILPPEPDKFSWLDTIVTLGREPLYSVVNMLRPMEKMVEKWKVMMDNNTLAYKDPWVSAKQLLGQGGRSEQWIIYHPYFNRGNDIVIRKDIKGLMPIIKPLFGTTDYLPYQTYLVALDAIESHNRGKPQQAYFDKESAQAIKATAEKRFGVAKLMEFQSDIQKYNEALLDFAAESGIISKETAQYWKQEHQNYVPLRRIAETYEVFGGNRKTISRDLLPEAERVIFSRKGSQKQIRDIFESMIENTNHILASSERNILIRNIADMFTDIHNYNKSHKVGGAVIEEIDARGMEAYQDPTTGEIRYAIAKVRPKNFRPPKGRILVVREEGNPRFYDVAPEYYDDIFRVTNNVAKQVSTVMKVLSAPSHWLQAGAVVYDPTFPIRNIVRDQTSTWFTSKYGYLPTDFLKGIMSAIKKDDMFQKWLASGGDQSFLISADQAMSHDYFDKKVGKFARRKFDAYKRNPLLALQDFSKASEIGTRLGAFKNAYKRTGNVKLAAIESRDITADYGIHGAMTKQLFQLYPFLNARIQWTRTIVNTMKNPASFMLKGMAITIPAALNWLLNNQDEESKNLYQSLPTWRRVGLFNIRIPGTDHFLPLPKGFFGVLFASSIESLLDAAVKDDPRILEELPKQLFQEISPISNWPEVIPFLARPQIEMWANKKGYTGKPIVSESMKLLKPSEQFYNSTPEVIKKMGEALNWSPAKIEHYFKSYTGGAGIGAVNILDETLQAIGLVEK
ncbi:MAG TPA: LPD38 domain-containing protein, partial [Bacteroidales bacterium]|nr:LPD38 domain-containing protein [Bacteroidales bacterium]